MSSNKEEDDKAWWSDYQASTKLKRKWTKEKKSDLDELDDILGDLDDIVNKPDLKERRKEEDKKGDLDDLDDILGDLDDIVNKSDVKVELPKDVQHSKSVTVAKNDKLDNILQKSKILQGKFEEIKESDAEVEGVEAERDSKTGGTHIQKKLDQVDTINKKIEN